MKNMVDNVAIQVVENTLIAGISELFTPSWVVQMDPDLVGAIAKGMPQNLRMREQMQRKLDVLLAGSMTCRAYAERRDKGMLTA